MRFSIRPVREEDAEAIVAVLNPIIRAGKYTVMDRPVTLNDQIRFICSFPEHGIFNVAVDDDSRTVLGLQDVVPRSSTSGPSDHIGEISTFVSLESRGKGIGRGLSDATFQEARGLGFLKICATIRADNPEAVAFYRSLGFRIIGTARKHALAEGKLVDEILAEKLIDQE